MLFLTPLKVWSEDRRQARDFRTTVDAMVYCLMQEIGNAQIFVTFNFPGVPDVTMPIDRPSLAA